MPCVMLVPTSILQSFHSWGSRHFVIVYLTKLNLLYLNSLRLKFCFAREGCDESLMIAGRCERKRRGRILLKWWCFVFAVVVIVSHLIHSYMRTKLKVNVCSCDNLVTLLQTSCSHGDQLLGRTIHARTRVNYTSHTIIIIRMRRTDQNGQFEKVSNHLPPAIRDS